MATSDFHPSSSRPKSAVFQDSDLRSSNPPDLRRISQHAKQGDLKNPNKSFSSDLNSRIQFPDLVSPSQATANRAISIQSKAWVDVISEEKYHLASFQLNYYEPTIEGNMKLAFIDENLTNRAREKWINSIVFYVYGSRPYYKFLRDYIDRNWGIKSNYQLYSRENGFFILKCESAEDCERILSAGPYYYNKRLLFMKKWKPGMKMSRQFLHSMPIWIKLPNLDLDFWSVEALSRIASLLGHPLKLDNVTEDFIRLSYARILIEVSSEFSFPEAIPIKCYNGEIVWQKVEYEWKPTVCSVCNIFGHSTDMCKAVKMWIPKDNLDAANKMDIDARMDNQEFMNGNIAESRRTGNKLDDTTNAGMDVCQRNGEGVAVPRKENGSKCHMQEMDNNNISNHLSKDSTARDVNPFSVLAETNEDMQEVCEKENEISKVAGPSNSFKDVDSFVDKVVLDGKENKRAAVNNEFGENAVSKDSFMYESDSSFSSFSSTNSFKKRRTKLISNIYNNGNTLVIDEPLVEENPEWSKLVQQFQKRSKTKKAKGVGGNTGGVTKGGISKK